MRRIWVTGAGGLIGRALAESPAAPAGGLIPLARPDLDLADPNAVARRFEAERPELVVHCAALSRTPDCEADPALAWRLNVEVTARLAALDTATVVVLLSSDLVFDGRRGGYLESDALNPLSVYGRTKAAAEEVILRTPRGLVVRTSLNYGRSPTGDRGFNEVMEAAWRAGRPTPLYEDEFRNPIAASETARAIWGLVSAGAAGIVHVAGAERVSRLECGRWIAERRRDLRPQILARSLRSHSGPPRAPDTSMNCERAARLLGHPLPRFSEWLAAQPSEA